MAVGLNLLTFWGVGLPLCAFLGFKQGMGVRGLWIGMTTVRPFLACLFTATRAFHLAWPSKTFELMFDSRVCIPGGVGADYMHVGARVLFRLGSRSCAGCSAGAEKRGPESASGRSRPRGRIRIIVMTRVSGFFERAAGFYALLLWFGKVLMRA